MYLSTYHFNKIYYYYFSHLLQEHNVTKSSQSTCSDGSLLSMGSSEIDEVSITITSRLIFFTKYLQKQCIQFFCSRRNRTVTVPGILRNFRYTRKEFQLDRIQFRVIIENFFNSYTIYIKNMIRREVI